MWTPYKKSKYTQNEEYANSAYLRRYARLCKCCGYPYGKHYNITCPQAKDIYPKGYIAEFYPEDLNINIKIL